MESNGWVMWKMGTFNDPCGNGNHTTYKNGDDWGIVDYCFIHIVWKC